MNHTRNYLFFSAIFFVGTLMWIFGLMTERKHERASLEAAMTVGAQFGYGEAQRGVPFEQMTNGITQLWEKNK